MSDDPISEVRSSVQHAVDAAPLAARREVKRWWPFIVLANAVLTVLLIVGGSYVVGRQNTTDAKISTLQSLADTSKRQGDQANQTLKRRGQSPVPIPNPTEETASDVIVSSAAAKVLASLPNTSPTAAQLGKAVAAYLSKHPVTPVGPTPGQISQSLAGYFATNPAPAGKDGQDGSDGAAGIQGASGKDGKDGKNGNDGADCDPDKNPDCRGPQGPQGAQGAQGERGPQGPAGASGGEQGPAGPPGPAPTEAQIQQAFSDYLKDNPNALCPKGGTFTLTRVVTANGGSQDMWSCVVTTHPPIVGSLPDVGGK